MKRDGVPPMREVSNVSGIDTTGAVWAFGDGPSRKSKKLENLPPVAHVASPGVRPDSDRCFVGMDGTVLCVTPFNGTRVVEGVSDVIAVATNGLSEGCALTKGAVVRCWEKGQPGEKGVITDVLTDAVHVFRHGQGYCGRRRDETVWCWGDNEYNVFGPSMPVENVPPGAVIGL
jgi:hypothetical protein